jgi:hypothetical protein
MRASVSLCSRLNLRFDGIGPRPFTECETKSARVYASMESPDAPHVDGRIVEYVTNSRRVYTVRSDSQNG